MYTPIADRQDNVDQITWKCSLKDLRAKVFNVVAVYTDDCVEEMPKRELVEAIVQSIDEMNEAFVNSEIGVQGRLVGIEEIKRYVYKTGPVSVPCDVYKDELLKEGGQFDEVFELGKKSEAHIILFVNSKEGGGTPQGGALPARSKREAFVVIPADQLLHEYTPAHEIAHLFGAQHDAGGYGLHPEAKLGDTAHGHVTEHWRTIMSYLQTKEGKPWGRKVIPYFSNPNVKYNGVPTGTQNANNAAQIEAYADTILSLRD